MVDLLSWGENPGRYRGPSTKKAAGAIRQRLFADCGGVSRPRANRRHNDKRDNGNAVCGPECGFAWLLPVR